MSREEDILNTVQSELGLSSELHVGGSSNFKLPEGWIMEEKPRPSKPNHVDKVHILFFTHHQVLFFHSCMHA